MQYRAVHRFADMSARKIRPFAAMIRGKNADEALEALRFYPNRACRLIEGVLKSALGNAANMKVRDVEDLVVVESRVDDGPIMKRIMPRARGTAYPIKRRYAHIIIAVGNPADIGIDNDVDDGDEMEPIDTNRGVENATPALTAGAGS